MAEFAGVKERITPTVIVTLLKVGQIVQTPGKKCKSFFETFLSDDSTEWPVRAVVFDDRNWYTLLKKLEFKKVVLKAGHYYITKVITVSDLKNNFEIRYKFLPVPLKNSIKRVKV